MDLSSAVGRNLLRIRMSHSTVRHGVLRRAWLILVYTQELYALPSRLQHCCLPDLNRRFLLGQGKLVPAGGVEPSEPLQTRKLFIPRPDKSDKTARNAEPRYTAGTRDRRHWRIYLGPAPSSESG